MQIKNRINKIEKALKIEDNRVFAGRSFMVWNTENNETYSVKEKNEQLFVGTKQEAWDFVKPFENGGACVVWIKVLRDHAH